MLLHKRTFITVITYQRILQWSQTSGTCLQWNQNIIDTLLKLIRYMCTNESVYANPTEFRPDRFLDDPPMDPRNLVFGFGRRCAIFRVSLGESWLSATKDMPRKGSSWPEYLFTSDRYCRYYEYRKGERWARERDHTSIRIYSGIYQVGIKQ